MYLRFLLKLNPDTRKFRMGLSSCITQLSLDSGKFQPHNYLFYTNKGISQLKNFSKNCLKIHKETFLVLCRAKTPEQQIALNSSNALINNTNITNALIGDRSRADQINFP